MRGGGMHPKGTRLAAALAAGICVSGAAASGAQAERPPLRENAQIYDSLFAAAVGDEIRKNCPSISARMFRVWRGARELEAQARAQGYTEEEVKAFLKSKTERARMRRLRDAYLESHGVVEDDPQSYCRLGREEIARNTLTGSLLRAH
jgi:hypothetical protein